MFKLVLLSVGLLYVLCEVSAAPKGLACPTLKLKFGRVRYRQKGRFVKFMCNTGYIIAGEKYSTCHNGAWDSPLPKCVRASCVKVNPPINGLIYPSHRGAVLNFFCKPGFELRGPNATYCDGRSWDNNLPACIASNSKPALSCDFESEDLCGWNHDLRHDFDWTRMNFRTPSGHLGTGPSFDHTKGEGQNGYYMYIESSSRNENDTARLISPIYDKINDTDVCLEFYYHMHGASTGQLRAYLKKESDSWILEPHNALFWKSGNHGDRWLRSLSVIGPIDEDFQIILEGVRGASYFSDIAVDDVQIIKNCTVDEDVTTESDVTYTDDYQTMQSCLNRCDNDNYINPPAEVFQFSCGCDDTCLDNNTCCPDYIAICVLGVTDDFSMTDVPTTLGITTMVQRLNEMTTATVKSPTKINIITPQEINPKKNKTQQINSNEINSVLPKNQQNSSNFPPFKKYNPTKVPNFNPVPQPAFVPKGKKPALIFLTPSTPEVIVQKVKVITQPQVPTPPPPIPTRRTPRPIPTKPPISILTPTKPRIPTPPRTTPTRRIPTPPPTTRHTMQVKILSSSGPIDEILTVPQKNEDDKIYFILATTAQAKVEDVSSPAAIKNYGVDRTENQKIIKEKPQTNAKFIIVIVASVSFILLIVLSAVFLVRRYKFLGCRNMNKMNSSSDSQSDVRFLTSDEMLDFNLACPDD